MPYLKKNISIGLLMFCLIVSVLFTPGSQNQARAAYQLVKGSMPAVYFVDEEGNRHVFMNEKVYYSWYEDWSGVTQISDAELAGYPLVGVVTYRPGYKLVKIQSDAKVYAVDAGGELRWITSEGLAILLYGENWNQTVDDVEPGLFASFSVGEDVTSSADYQRETVMAATKDIQTDIRNKGRKVGHQKNDPGTNDGTGGTGSGDTGTGDPGTGDTGTGDSGTGGTGTGGTGSGDTGTGDTGAGDTGTGDTGTTTEATYIFDNAMADGWILSGWNDYSTSIENGRILANYLGAWSAVTFEHRSEYWDINWLPSSDYEYLCFDLTPIGPLTTGHQNLEVSVGETGDSFTLSQEMVLTAGSTNEYCLPMASLTAGSSEFYRIVFFNYSNTGGFSHYLDNVRLTDTAGGTTPDPDPEPNPEPPPATSGEVLAINLNQTSPISPLIYGTNEWLSGATSQTFDFYRMGGNRYSAYNWEINSSNAGTDWQNSSDRYLSSASGDDPSLNTMPGQHVKEGIVRARARGAATLITVPMLDHVVADADGSVSGTAATDPSRWVANSITKPGALSLQPDLNDGAVYQEEFVNFIQNNFPDAQTSSRPVLYSLDNEPALWPTTHPLPHPAQTTYAELMARTTDAASMIKSRVPQATVFGPVLYGFGAYTNLQDAPDANGRDFLDYYLSSLQQYENLSGTRLVDVLDLHWYPEAYGGGVRITDTGSNPSSALIEARLQAPRSLWDPTYREDSWIADWYFYGPVSLLPWLNGKIDSQYPGTKIAFTEYNYGGGGHISGGLAQADVLGVFGRAGVYAASLWPMGTNTSYQVGAFRLFRDYDGLGGQVGDLAVPVDVPDDSAASVYAFKDSQDSGAFHIIAINKTASALDFTFDLPDGSGFSQARGFRMHAGTPNPAQVGTTALTTGQTLNVSLPAYSATTYKFE